MAFLEIKNVAIKGIAAGVPKNTINNLTSSTKTEDYDSKAFVETTGVFERRFSKDYTTSDLCYNATEKLIQDLNWDKKDIDAIIFLTQTPDYILPATSCILQDRLGLSKECYALDISLGCSGWAYGLSVLASLMSSGTIRKGLLLVGDAKSYIDVEYSDPLFGHAGTATALVFEEGCPSLKFHFGTDGSGADSLITPDGGCRNQITMKSFEIEEVDGKKLCRLETRMKGMDVFSFGISVPPKSIKKLSENFNFDYQDYDYFIFHQANMKINNMISKKLKLDSEKVPECISHFGNTSSASIPLTIVTQLNNKLNNNCKFICCGFGVGLSWSSVAFETNNLVISDLVEV